MQSHLIGTIEKSYLGGKCSKYNLSGGGGGTQLITVIGGFMKVFLNRVSGIAIPVGMALPMFPAHSPD